MTEIDFPRINVYARYKLMAPRIAEAHVALE